MLIRFSALGDVILLRPTVDSLLELYSNVTIWIVSNKKNHSLFNHHERVKFIGVDLGNNIFKIFKQIKQQTSGVSLDVVYDLHDVIRSKIIRLLLVNKTQKTRVFYKNRSLKKQIIDKKIKLTQLKHSSERYADCLKNDFPKIDFSSFKKVLKFKGKKKDTIGIAPFAAHESKQWELTNYSYIFKKYDTYNFIIFAFGKKERLTTEKLFLKFKNVEIISNKSEITDQMELINECKVFLSMDSANMHLASLTSTAVVSIWGPTHPFLGFGPLFNEKHIVQLNKLSCRPCSVYGKIKNKHKECAKKSMNGISPKMVAGKIEFALKN